MRMFLTAALLTTVALPGVAQAQVEGIAAGATVGSIVSQLEQSVKNTIDHADDAVSNNSFRVRQHLEILLSQLNAIADRQREKTFAQLNDTQQRAFLNIKNSIEQLSQLEHATAADVQRTSYTVGTAMGNLPFGSATPRVIDYSPAYVLGRPQGAPAAMQTVSVSGISLGEGTPRLKLQNKPCTLASKTEIALSFSCPSQNWLAGSGVTAATGDLEVYEKAGFFARLFGGKPAPRPYKVSLFVIPPTIGDYDLKVARAIQTTESNARSQDFRADNGHCDGDREILFPFNAQPDWTIDPQSIHVDCDTSSDSSCSGLRNVAATSFGYLGKVRNHGNCGPFWKDARGNVRGHVTWTETRSVTSVVTEPVGQGKLTWGRAEQLVLPSGVQSISLTVDQIDGKRIIVTGSDLAQRWYTVQSDPVNNFVLVSPRAIEQAMAN